MTARVDAALHTNFQRMWKEHSSWVFSYSRKLEIDHNLENGECLFYAFVVFNRACHYFDPERGSFSTLYINMLKQRFKAEFLGHKKRKTKAPPIGPMTEEAVSSMANADMRSWRSSENEAALLEAIPGAMRFLTAADKDVLQEVVVKGRTNESYSKDIGRCKERARQMRRDAVAKLRKAVLCA